MKKTKRFLCLLLTFMLLLEYIPVALPANATQEDGICEKHHAVHDVSICGYVAAVQGVPCQHAEFCNDECRQEVRNCLFNHVDCGCTEEVTCDHQCTVENGCITYVCTHQEHDGTCGYVAAVEGHACSFAGQACVQCAAEAQKTCAENCTLEAGHDGECTLSCGCPVTVTEHLESCKQIATYSQTLPMYARITGGDGNGNTTVDHFGSMTEPGNSVGPWLTFVASQDSETAFTGFSTSDSEIVALEYANGNSNNPALRLLFGKEGVATITHSEGDTVYSFTVTVQKAEEPVLRYRINDQGNIIGGRWRLAPNSEGKVKFYIGTNRFTQIDQENGQKFSLTNITVTDSTILQLTGPDQDRFYTYKALKGGETTITCEKDNQEYTLTIVVEEPQLRMIPVQPMGTPNWIDLIDLEVGKPVKLRCMLAEVDGPPVSEALTGLESSNNQIFTLELSNDPAEASAGVHILTPVSPGEAQLCYQQDGKEYFCEVGILDKNFQADGLLYYPAVHIMSGKTYPCTVVNIPVGEGFAREFFYSQPAEAALLADGDSNLTPLTITDVTWSGPIEVDQPDNDTRLHITGTDVGTGYLEVTSDDGIIHCFVVNVGKDRPNTEVQEGGYMWLDDDTVIGFGNPGIASNGDNNAEEGVMKLRAQVNSGFGSMNYPEDFRYREPVAFAAMNQTDGKPDADIMAKVKNVEFSILACQNTDGTSGSYASVEKTQCEQVALTEGNIKAWTNYIVANGTDAFKGLVGMRFELPDTKDGQPIIRQMSLYILLHNTYMGEEVRVLANVTSAKQLNVILSSYEALKTWIKQEYPEYADTVDNACSIDLKLPAEDLTDAVVVSEAIAPFPFRPNPSSNPNFRVYLLAPSQGKRTTIAGLISRGSLAGIFDVSFIADSDVTMQLGEEVFTCGLMADSTWSGNVEYDMEFAAKYGIDPMANKRNLSSWNQDGDMKYADCDILSVDGCSFEGFDYGTRSTPNGYVGGGVGNSFKNCYFGIYIDCEGKPGWGDIHYTGFSGYDFKKNVAAVRIVGLQDNITPYEFRIHDCDFINNYLEFWINDYNTTYLQNYYFYRNHYRGGWKLSSGNSSSEGSSGYGWVKHKGKAPNNEELTDVHRGPKYQVQDGTTIINNGVSVIISGTPGKAVPNLAVNSRIAEEGYWIYDGEDQVTRIELGGDSLPLAQESLEALTKDADVSIVKNQGADTAAIWTFEGGN